MKSSSTTIDNISMFAGVALALSELPRELIERHGLGRRICDRGGELELQFLLRDHERIFPVG